MASPNGLGRGYAVGTFGDLLLVVWFDSPTLSDFAELERATARIAGEHADGFGILVVIVEGNDKPPPNEVRRRNAALVERYNESIWGMARVIEGSGVKASMVRFALSTIDLLSSTSVPEKTLDSVESAVTFLHGLRPSLHERGVLREVEKLKAAAGGPRRPMSSAVRDGRTRRTSDAPTAGRRRDR